MPLLPLWNCIAYFRYVESVSLSGVLGGEHYLRALPWLSRKALSDRGGGADLITRTLRLPVAIVSSDILICWRSWQSAQSGRKKIEDFRPGQPLEDIFTTYVNVSPPGKDAGKFKVISHVEQLARSTCVRKSNGQLWCGTCHDPHDKPLEPVQFYRTKCLSCHMEKFSASHPGKDSNCIGCHMPRRDAKDGGHTAFTDHRIQRRPEPQQALPEDTDIAAWREPAPDLQKRNLGIAYINAGMEHHSPPFVVRGYRMLTAVQSQFSNDADFFTSIGSALLLGKTNIGGRVCFRAGLAIESGLSPRRDECCIRVFAGWRYQPRRHSFGACRRDRSLASTCRRSTHESLSAAGKYRKGRRDFGPTQRCHGEEFHSNCARGH